MFMVPMDTPGITVRPIRSMLGPHHLNEVFFDDVMVNAEQIDLRLNRLGLLKLLHAAMNRVAQLERLAA